MEKLARKKTLLCSRRHDPGPVVGESDKGGEDRHPENQVGGLPERGKPGTVRQNCRRRDAQRQFAAELTQGRNLDEGADELE